jgi:hypothetical protein
VLGSELIAEACPIFQVMATGIRRKINVTWLFALGASRLAHCGNSSRSLPPENNDATRSLALP